MTVVARAAGIYVRISRDRDGERLGVQRQREDCESLAERLGWQVHRVYIDNDVSAYSGRRRPEYEALLADLKSKTIDAVICWHPDRLHRSPRELEAFIDVIEQTKAKVATVTAGDYDLATASGRMVARYMGAGARFESEHKSDRTRRKHLELAAAGKFSGGGTRAFGFLNRLEVDRHEAKLVREAVRRLLDGDTLHGVCNDWNARQIPTVTGTRWTPHVLRRIVTSGRICGWREHHGELVAPAVWPAIVSREEVERLRSVLHDPTRTKNRNPRRYLLTGGLARCGLCGAALVARPKDGGARQYVCASAFGGCGKIARLADPLETFVVDLVLRRVDTAGLASTPRPDDDSQVMAEIRGCEAKLVDLAEQWAKDEISREEWVSARTATSARLAAARRRLDWVPQPVLEGGLSKRWHTLGFDRQRAILTAVVEKVMVNPATKGFNRFDPSKIDVTWRV